MLNEGTRTAELHLARWVLDPDASDTAIVDAMRLPATLSLETLAMDEVATVAGYHRHWSANAGLDTAELFLRNSTCKRALYLSAPIFLPDTIPVARFVATHVNSRIHLYRAPEVTDTIRLEAVSSFEPNDFRFRYALSIQYAADSAGLGWQVIRPVIILDRRIMTAVHDAGAAARHRLERVLAALGKIVLFGSHDYVHATVLNWFPPLRGLPPEYAEITCERVHPPEVERWHQGTQAALPAGLVDGRPTPEVATLELYSLMVHGETIARLWEEEPGLRAHAAGLVREFCAALDALLDDGRPGGLMGAAALTQEAADFFTTLAFWFVVSALPIGSQRLAHVLDGAPPACRRACERLAQVHEGMFDFVQFADPAAFPWQGGYVPVHEVEVQYSDALCWPAIRTYLDYLMRPRRTGGPGSWAQALCAPLPAGERDALLAALASLAASTSQQEYESALAALAGGGQLGQLRAVALAGDPAGPGPDRFARAILASFVAVTDALHGRRPRVPA